MTEPDQRRGMPRAFVLLAVPAVALIVVVGMRELAWLIGPAMLALTIVILVHPVHRGLLRRGVPPVVALVGLLLAIYGVVLGLLVIISYSLMRLATIMPRYASAVNSALTHISGQLASVGIGSAEIRGFIEEIDVAKLVTWIAGRLPTLAGMGANVLFLFSLLLFLGIESSGVTRRAAQVMATRPRVGTALLDFVHKTRRYVAVTGFFAVIVGVCDSVLLAVIGIPLAPLWGLLAAACNFIPYVGFIIGVIPPALLALLGANLKVMLFVIAAYIVMNSVFTTVLPAKFVGNAVGMSMTVTMISVVFWSWVLGPVGSVLAVPLSLLAKGVLIDADPRAAWLSGFVDSAESRRSRRRRQGSPTQPDDTDSGPDGLTAGQTSDA